MLIGCATAASLFPFVGTIVYMILRPPEYLEDVRERELELQAAEARLHELDHVLCPHCDYRIERDFMRCPSCLRKLKERCTSCSRPLDQAGRSAPTARPTFPAAAPARARRRERASRRGAAQLFEHEPARRARLAERRGLAPSDARRRDVSAVRAAMTRRQRRARGGREPARSRATQHRGASRARRS